MEEANSVIIEEYGAVALLEIKGDVTKLSEAPLKDAYNQVDPGKTKKLLFKFNEKTYFNSEGLKVIILLLSEARKNHQEIAVTGLSAHFKKIFGMVGITKFARIFDNTDKAMEALKAPDEC